MRQIVRLFDYLAILAVTITIMWASENFLGEVEGRFWPIVGPVTLTGATHSPPPIYRFTWRGGAQKYRDCDFVRLEWFMGPRGGRRVQVGARFSDRPQVRDIGRLEWDGLEISLLPSEVLENSHAMVIHRCHPLWLTRSRFFDSVGEMSKGTEQ